VQAARHLISLLSVILLIPTPVWEVRSFDLAVIIGFITTFENV
jgi:hypothetical protein